MQFVDSHCHIDFEHFNDDRAEVLEQASRAGVLNLIVPGVSAASWPRQMAVADKFAQVSNAFGLHPYFLQQFQQQDLSELASRLQSSNVVAVGECGIDGTVANIPLQQEVFYQQVVLANRFHLPLIIHHRKSHHLILGVFKRLKPQWGGVIHAFSGSINDAQKYLSLGFKLGCGGVITYERAAKTRDVFCRINLEDILLETDAPDMPLHGYQGLRNEPKQVVRVAQVLALLRQQSIEEIAKVTSANAKALFNL